MDITVLIITKNAAETLKRTLESVSELTHEIIIVDDYSTDETKRIARELGCKVILHTADNFGSQRAFALTQVKSEWTLILDSDEVLTSSNRKEIRIAIKDTLFNGYLLRFQNHLFGKKLLHGELHKKLVLFRTQKASIGPMEIHEQYVVSGKIGELTSEVNHFSYRSYLQIKRKFIDYAIKQAREYKRKNIRYGWRELLLNPLHMFYARFIKDGGYKDGFARLILDKSFATMEFLSYALIPFVKKKKRIGIDCGGADVKGTVKSGIERIIQGIYSVEQTEADHFWFSYDQNSLYILPRFFFSQLWLPLATLFNRCDVFLGVAGNIPFILRFFRIKKILFLYDFGFFTSPDKYMDSANRLKFQTEQSIRMADKIILLNNLAYEEFSLRFPQYVYKATVIPAGADHLLHIKESPVPLKMKKPFLLYVGVVKPVKRIDLLLSAVGDRNTVIVGQQEKDYMSTLRIGKTQNVQFIEKVTDSELKWLYLNAHALAYTSGQEGFCFPVLEALTFALPVFALSLPLFEGYKRHFPGLKLYNSVNELRNELLDLNDERKKNITANPYTWEAFNRSLQALCKPPRFARPTPQKIAMIVVLYKTPLQDRVRLEKEIEKIGIKSYKMYWIDNSTNGKGYAAGINEGIRKGLVDNCDLFIGLNPDISLNGISAQAIMDLASEFDVWGFGMKQNGIVYYGGEIDAWRLSGGLLTEKPKFQYFPVDYVSGSVMGFSKNIVETIGVWDESYFMYYEDVDYCIRARRAGYEVGIDTSHVYNHFEVSKLNEQKRGWIASSRWKFFWKYASTKQKLREIARLPKTIMGL